MEVVDMACIVKKTYKKGRRCPKCKRVVHVLYSVQGDWPWRGLLCASCFMVMLVLDEYGVVTSE